MAGIMKLFGGSKKPRVEPPAEAPTPDDPDIQRKRRRRAAIARQQSGVAATNTAQVGTRETMG